ncbi:MAG: hypothetical protein WCF22_01945 [Candidatus Sulfotelmatobacter sp.]
MGKYFALRQAHELHPIRRMIAAGKSRGKYTVALAVGLMIFIFILVFLWFRRNKNMIQQPPMHAMNLVCGTVETCGSGLAL